MKEASNFETKRYALLGAAFGLMFPLIATFVSLGEQNLSFSASNIALIHSSLLMIMIDSAPIFLGLFAALAGRRQDKVNHILKIQDGIIKERTEELRSAVEEAKQAAKAKASFLAVMSHEIRTPMNAVIGMNELMLRSPLDDKQRRYAQTIQTSAHSLLTIINDILDFSKIEAGKMDIRKAPFYLRRRVFGVARTLAQAAHEKGVELLCSVHPSTPDRVNGDPDRLAQIITNLVGNAVKFTDEGEVELRVQPVDNNRLKFSIRDTGIGITEENQKKLFAAFSQADASVTRKFGGTGLGLAICRQLVNIMGGDIRVESEPGEGSTFIFEVEMEAVEAAPDLDRQLDVRIVAADDNPTNREILSEQLDALGIEHLVVESGIELLQAQENAIKEGKPYQIAVIDGHMPGMDGQTVVKHIAAGGERMAATKTVILASFDHVLAEHRIIADRWLVKPVSEFVLAETFEDVLSDRPESKVALQEEVKKIDATILLVEDNEVNQFVALEALEAIGLSADVAENGQEAIDRYNENSYDLILMDCQMPIMDGYEATEKIRELEGNARHTPILALTANASSQDREDALAAGMDDHLAKPMTIEGLRKMVEKWLFSPNSSHNSGGKKAQEQ